MNELQAHNPKQDSALSDAEDASSTCLAFSHNVSMSAWSDPCSNEISQTLLPYKDPVEQGNKSGVEVVHDNPCSGFDSRVRRQQSWMLLTGGKVLDTLKVVREIGQPSSRWLAC